MCATSRVGGRTERGYTDNPPYDLWHGTPKERASVRDAEGVASRETAEDSLATPIGVGGRESWVLARLRCGR
ncbi:MAG: hypothetical protein QOI01_5835 [Mycobacterium sp.]|jgi:hypothetical protein|nr:hypothetical protein [Mycobacterium sp.]